MEIAHPAGLVIHVAARIGRRHHPGGELDAVLRRCDRAGAEQMREVFHVAAIEPERKRKYDRQRRIMAAPHLVDAEHDRFDAGMMRHEIAHHGHVFLRAGARRGELDEARPGRLRQLRRIEQLAARIAEHRRIEARIAPAARIGGARTAIEDTRPERRRKAAGVVGIDHQQECIDRSEAAEEDAEEDDGEAAPHALLRHRGRFDHEWHACLRNLDDGRLHGTAALRTGNR